MSFTVATDAAASSRKKKSALPVVPTWVRYTRTRLMLYPPPGGCARLDRITVSSMVRSTAALTGLGALSQPQSFT